MLKYIIRRLFLMIPTLIGITLVVFLIMAMSPGGVGGNMLSEHGEMEAERSKALREYYERRYGLDKPLFVQYGRWLNRVSPIGFRTSSQIKFSDEQVADVRVLIERSGYLESRRPVDEAVHVATTIAAFNDIDPVDGTNLLLSGLKEPTKGIHLFEKVDSESSGDFEQELLATTTRDLNAGRLLLLTQLSNHANGTDRILFNRPAFKVPDLGESMAKGRTIIDLYSEALPITLLLNLITTPIIYIVAILTGIAAASKRGAMFDVVSGTATLGLWSIPTMWAGVMLIGFLASDQHVQWFPAGGLSSAEAVDMAFLPGKNVDGFQRGWLLDRCWHLVLPIICLTYGGFAFLMKLTRATMLENIMSDYVRTARAKGLDEQTILWRHAFRNCLLPLITIAAFIIPGLLVGSIIVEKIFGIDGMGKLTIDAIYARDSEVVLAGSLVAGGLTLVCILIADVCYAIADPRVSYD